MRGPPRGRIPCGNQDSMAQGESPRDTNTDNVRRAVPPSKWGEVVWKFAQFLDNQHSGDFVLWGGCLGPPGWVNQGGVRRTKSTG